MEVAIISTLASIIVALIGGGGIAAWFRMKNGNGNYNGKLLSLIEREFDNLRDWLKDINDLMIRIDEHIQHLKDKD